MSFEAKYHGECSACGGHIKPGDHIGYNLEHEIVHVTCPTSPEPQRPICPSCFMEVPVNGECGCDG